MPTADLVSYRIVDHDRPRGQLAGRGAQDQDPKGVDDRRAVTRLGCAVPRRVAVGERTGPGCQDHLPPFGPGGADLVGGHIGSEEELNAESAALRHQPITQQPDSFPPRAHGGQEGSPARDGRPVADGDQPA